MVRFVVRVRNLALVVGAAWLLVGCGQPSPEEWLQRSRDAQAQGDFETAVIAAKNVVQAEPQNPEGRRLLGEIQLARAEYAAAEKELSRAVDLGLPLASVAEPLGQALLALDQPEALLERLQALDPATIGSSAALLGLRARAAFSIQNHAQAKADFQALQELAPGSVVARVGLARLAVVEGDVAAAEAHLEAAVELDPRNADTWSARGDLARTLGQLQDATTYYGEAVALDGLRMADWFQLAMLQVEARNFEGARASIERIRQRTGITLAVEYLNGLLALREGDLATAQASLERALSRYSAHYQSRYHLGVVYFLQDRIAQAEQTLSLAVEQRPNAVAARRMQALVRLRQGDHGGARGAADGLLEVAPEDPFALLVLAQVAEREGDNSTAIAALRRLVAAHPDWAAGRAKLGAAELATGRTEQGVEEIRRVLQLNPGLLNAGALAVIQAMERRDWDQAEALLQVLQAEGQGTIADQLAAAVAVGRGDRDAGINAYRQLLARNPGDPVAVKSLGYLLLQDGRQDEVVALYRNAVSSAPQVLSLRLDLGEILLANGDTDAMLKVLNQAATDFPARPEPVAVLSRWEARQGRSSAALERLGRARTAQGDPPLLRVVEAEILLALGQVEQALRVIEQLDPADLQQAQQRIRLFSAARRPDKVEATLRAVLAARPAAATHRRELVRRLIERGELDAAARELAVLQRQHPESAADALLRAEVALRSGNPKAALAEYRRAHAMNPTPASARVLGRALWAAERPNEALTLLRTWVADHPEHPALLYELATYERARGNASRTLELLHRAEQADPANPVVLNDLAWLLRESDPGRAEAYIQRARGIDAESIQLMDTEAMVALAQNDHARAGHLLDQARARSAGDPTLDYHRALVYAAEGRTAEARALVEAALGSQRPFPERLDAEGLLPRLRSGG